MAKSDRTGIEAASDVIGDPEALDLLSSLVAIAPTNLEDPAHQRYEKAHYSMATDRIVRVARHHGFATQVYDPVADPKTEIELPGGPRPNAIIDLDLGAPKTALIMAHYDVVPVPTEQISRWKSPPFILTARDDGRLYGRGSNDDLGSGVVGSLIAMKRLSASGASQWNLRLLVCCDEETGGEGGIDAIRAHDARLPADSPERILRADVALIPDGSPHTTAGSSGVAFLDATVQSPIPLSQSLVYGERLKAVDAKARAWRSALRSEDWPQHGAPEPIVTGRATLTKFDIPATHPAAEKVRLVLAHTETEAANQIARSVTLAFTGPAASLAALREKLTSFLPTPFHLETPTASGVPIPKDTLALAVVGKSGHGGYPHRAQNPVPPTLSLLRAAIDAGLLDGGTATDPSFVVDLRLTPEMELHPALDDVLAELNEWSAAHLPEAHVVAPPGRCRPGYSLPPDHPMVRKLARSMKEVFNEETVYGEYGGTDASSLRGLTTPSGEPLPALVFGSMDRRANIHEAEESIDPRYLAGVIRLIEQFVSTA
jgi:acetylornithine deacetylase/succinyl-diaminopimelate desuccinylase-like protein